MPTDDPRPVVGLSGVEAGEILGVTQLMVSQYVANGVLPKAVRYQHHGLDRGDVERLPSGATSPAASTGSPNGGRSHPRD